MNDHDDLNKTRRYLQLDPDELENVRAEQAKYERRKAAMAHADANSRVEPVSFAPIRCAGCSVLLTTQNHAGERCCERCLPTVRFERAQQDYLATRQPTAAPLHWLSLCALAVLAGLGAYWLGGIIAGLAWRAGQ